MSFSRWWGILSLLVFARASLYAQNTWTLRHESGPGGEFLWSIVQGDPGMVTVGTGGKILFSSDATTWTPVASGTTDWLVGVTYGKGQYVAVGDHGTVLHSTDGITWSRAKSSGTVQRLNNVVYGNGKYVAVGEAGTIVISTDGDVWTPVQSGVTGWLRGLVSSPLYYLATGQAGAAVTSLDGVQWTRKVSPAGLDLEAVDVGDYYSYIGTNGRSAVQSIIAVGAQGSVAELDSGTFGPGMYVNWTNLPNTGKNVQLRSISVLNQAFVATGEDGAVLTAKYKNGPWTANPVPTSSNIVAAGRGLGSLFLVGANETILQSETIFESRLVNISSRGYVGTGDQVLIVGTIVVGNNSLKNFLVRGVGPTLTDFQVPNVLAEPTVEVFDGSGHSLGVHGAWGSEQNPLVETYRQRANAFPLKQNSKDCAFTFSPPREGSYTFVLRGVSGSQGVALLEAYDMDATGQDVPRAVNVSTRGYVGTNENVLIGGIVVQGPGARKLLIRGVGPTLAQFGVTGVLADPVLELYKGSTLIATNDNWGVDTVVDGHTVTGQEVALASNVAHVFPLADNSKDAALLVTLSPGAYTFQVHGANGTTGVALVEAYEVPSSQ